jgi:predicted 3-demethylubiquinone-9 3-methyltransferase (glyoxalase superfamily)
MTDKVRPCITFKDRAEEAVKFYVSLFPNSRITDLTRVESDGGPIPKGKLLGALFELDGREFRAFDGGESFTFSEGISLDVTCKTQAEVDRYWNALTANGGEEGPCGWLKDRFGVSWQIVPEQLGQMLSDPRSGNAEACMNAMLKMKKLDIATLEKAYRGSPVG